MAGHTKPNPTYAAYSLLTTCTQFQAQWPRGTVSMPLQHAACLARPSMRGLGRHLRLIICACPQPLRTLLSDPRWSLPSCVRTRVADAWFVTKSRNTGGVGTLQAHNAQCRQISRQCHHASWWLCLHCTQCMQPGKNLHALHYARKPHAGQHASHENWLVLLAVLTPS